MSEDGPTERELIEALVNMGYLRKEFDNHLEDFKEVKLEVHELHSAVVGPLEEVKRTFGEKLLDQKGNAILIGIAVAVTTGMSKLLSMGGWS